MYCGAFAVAGFIVSLYVDNKVWLMLSPLAYVFGSMILFEGIPYGQLVSYNSYVSLYLPQYIHAPSEIMTACICMLSIILLIAMEFLFIHYKGRRDL